MGYSIFFMLFAVFGMAGLMAWTFYRHGKTQPATSSLGPGERTGPPPNDLGNRA